MWRTQRSIWCQNHGLPVEALSIPEYSGGLGIEAPPSFSYYTIEPRIPRPTIQEANVHVDEIPTQPFINKSKYYVTRYDLQVDQDTIDRVVQREATSTLTSDNVPLAARLMRKTWIDEVRSTKFKIIRHNNPVTQYQYPVNLSLYPPNMIDQLFNDLKRKAPLYGVNPEIATARVDYNDLRPNMTFQSWLMKYYPSAYSNLRKFHRTWHMSEKLDYLEGSITLYPKIIHPALVSLLSYGVAAAFPPKRRSSRHEMVSAGQGLERYIFHSPISQLVYMW
jgi:hypothetical protein